MKTILDGGLRDGVPKEEVSDAEQALDNHEVAKDPKKPEDSGGDNRNG